MAVLIKAIDSETARKVLIIFYKIDAICKGIKALQDTYMLPPQRIVPHGFLSPR